MGGRAMRVRARESALRPTGYQPTPGSPASPPRRSARGRAQTRRMAPFEVTVDTPLSPGAAWERLTDWAAHGRHVPFTTVRAVGPAGVGGGFVARTAVGRLGFDDPMDVVVWEPPRFCRIEKRGRAVRGWAELSVTARGSGSRVVWREEARPACLPGFAAGAADKAGRLVFGRVVRRLLAGPRAAGGASGIRGSRTHVHPRAAD